MTKNRGPRKKRQPASGAGKAKKPSPTNQTDNTKRAYRSAWSDFLGWADDNQAQSLPAAPQTVADYLTALARAGTKVSTLEVRRAAIRSAHQAASQPDPTRSELVRAVLSELRREHRGPQQRKAPVTIEALQAIVAALPDDLAGKRDKALILTGFAGAFRRAELVALDVEDIQVNGELRLNIPSSRPGNRGGSDTKTIPAVRNRALDPISAMRAWLAAAEIKTGPVFRRIDRWGKLRAERLAPQAVATILKRAAEAAGLDPSQLSGHSLRSGFISAAASANVPEWKIQQQTGHKSGRALRGYIQDQDQGHGAQDAVRGAINGHPVKGKGEK